MKEKELIRNAKRIVIKFGTNTLSKPDGTIAFQEYTVVLKT